MVHGEQELNNGEYLGVSSSENGGYPKIAGRYIRGNPTKIWMMTGGTPMTMETPRYVNIYVNHHLYIMSN